MKHLDRICQLKMGHLDGWKSWVQSWKRARLWGCEHRNYIDNEKQLCTYVLTDFSWLKMKHLDRIGQLKMGHLDSWKSWVQSWKLAQLWGCKHRNDIDIYKWLWSYPLIFTGFVNKRWAILTAENHEYRAESLHTSQLSCLWRDSHDLECNLTLSRPSYWISHLLV